MESDYRRHLSVKAGRLARLLSEAGIERPAPRIRPSPLTGGFRTRAQFKIFGGPGEPVISGNDPRLGRVPAEQALWLLPEGGRRQVETILSILKRTHRDVPVDGFELRLEHGGGGAHVTLNLARGVDAPAAPMLEDLLRQVPGLRGAAVPSRRESLGEEFLRHNLEGMVFHSHYSAFFQSNFRLLPLLLQEFEKWGGRDSPPRAILDLYCGVGLFSLWIGEGEDDITGIDVHPRAIESARRNAAALGFDRPRFRAERAERFLDEETGGADMVIVNPSRAGCDPIVIPALARGEPASVVMISCDPTTMVRDLAVWRTHGYAVDRLSAFDMFPFTPFLETAALLIPA